MRTSKLFSKLEYTSLMARFRGVRKDKTGVFSGRVKPKVKELLVWFKHKDILEKAIEPKRGKK